MARSLICVIEHSIIFLLVYPGRPNPHIRARKQLTLEPSVNALHAPHLNSPLTESNQVTNRTCLPQAIRNTLLPLAREDWSQHPAYSGKAAFFIHYHTSMLEAVDYMVLELGVLLHGAGVTSFGMEQVRPILRAGKYLIDKAHQHHYMEDTVYFPQFRQILPNFNAAMDLLDRDHKVLDKALHSLNININQLYSESTVTEQQLVKFYESTHMLQRILHRHLEDEEQIIIPIFLMGQ